MKLLAHTISFTVCAALLGCAPPLAPHPLALAKQNVAVAVPVAASSADRQARGDAPAVTGSALLETLLDRPDGQREAVDIMVVGDSTANCLGWGLRSLHIANLDVRLEAKDGCEILSETCGAADWARKAKAEGARATIVLLGGAFLYGVNARGQWQTACGSEWNTTFEDHLTEHLRDLMSTQSAVWVATIPYPLATYDTEAYRAQVDCINASIRKSVENAPGAKLLDLAHELCPTRRSCKKLEASRVLRPDGVHFDIEALGPLSRWVLSHTNDAADRVQGR